MRHNPIVMHFLASHAYPNLLFAFIIAGAIFVQGCGMPMEDGPQRYYPLPPNMVQAIAKKAASQIGFSIWEEEAGQFTTDWQTYSVGQMGWLWWKKEWKHRTRLTVFGTEVRNGLYGPSEMSVTAKVHMGSTMLKVISETEDSPANKDHWNVVSRPTEREQEIIRDFLKAIDGML